MRLSIFVTGGALVTVALIGIGIAISGVAGTGEYCHGPVSDSDLCANARLQLTIFGSVVVGSGIVAAAIVAGAAVLVSRSRTQADQ